MIPRSHNLYYVNSMVEPFPMATKRYYDDPDTGPTRETSHPRFLQLASDEFFLDCTDDFAPFGNDTGADTLVALEERYREGGRVDPEEVLGDLFHEWELDYADMPDATAAEEKAWLAANPSKVGDVRVACEAWIAAAFGQLKITGAMDENMRDGASKAIDGLFLFDPGDEERGKLERMRAVLRNLGQAPAAT